METDSKRIPVEELKFDPKNPRLPGHIDGNDEQAVLGWMLEDAGLVELMGSLATKGYFPAEPLLVTATDSGDGYWVLEGNRRLAAVMLLLDPLRAPRRSNAVAAMAEEAVNLEELRTLPCVIFRYKSDVLDYLGYRHITGIKQWEPAAKARYLRDLYDEHREAKGEDVYKYIARIIGSRSSYVKRLLAALTLHEAIAETGVGQIIESEDISFSLLTLALNYQQIAKYLGLGTLTVETLASLRTENLQNLATWLYLKRDDIERTQLGESRNMRFLATALSDQEGIDALLRGEVVEDAARAALDSSELLVRSLEAAHGRLLNAQAQLGRAEVTQAAVRMLDTLATLVDSLRAAAGLTQGPHVRDAEAPRDSDV